MNGRHWLLFAAFLMLAITFVLPALERALMSPLGTILERAPPSQAEVVTMIAAHEGTLPSDINLHVYDTSHDLPHVLYSIENVPEPAPVDRLPVVHRALTHPKGEPWNWTVGGGARGDNREPGAATSFSFSSASGDLDSEINTVIFGVTASNVTEVRVTINGKTHIQDVRETQGYLILLPDQGLNPGAITDFRALDDVGNELPPPIDT